MAKQVKVDGRFITTGGGRYEVLEHIAKEETKRTGQALTMQDLIRCALDAYIEAYGCAERMETSAPEASREARYKLLMIDTKTNKIVKSKYCPKPTWRLKNTGDI